MTTQVKSTKTKDQLIKLILLARAYKLHSPKGFGSFHRMYEEFLFDKDNSIKAAVLVFHNKEPVSIAIAHRRGLANFGVYTNTKFRRQGFGKLALEKLVKLFPKRKFKAFAWKEQQCKFFQSVIPEHRLEIDFP